MDAPCICAHQIVNPRVAERVAERLPQNIYLKGGGCGFEQTALPTLPSALEKSEVCESGYCIVRMIDGKAARIDEALFAIRSGRRGGHIEHGVTFTM